jgi:hypothetical protein
MLSRMPVTIAGRDKTLLWETNSAGKACRRRYANKWNVRPWPRRSMQHAKLSQRRYISTNNFHKESMLDLLHSPVEIH